MVCSYDTSLDCVWHDNVQQKEADSVDPDDLPLVALIASLDERDKETEEEGDGAMMQQQCEDHGQPEEATAAARSAPSDLSRASEVGTL